MYALVIGLGRHGRYYGSGIDALVLGANPTKTENPEIAAAQKSSTLNPK